MKITAILGGKTVYTNGVPSVEGGKPEMIESNNCECRQRLIDNETEHTEIVEYWLEGELVHRSVNMTLKQNVLGEALLGAF